MEFDNIFCVRRTRRTKKMLIEMITFCITTPGLRVLVRGYDRNHLQLLKEQIIGICGSHIPSYNGLIINDTYISFGIYDVPECEHVGMEFHEVFTDPYACEKYINKVKEKYRKERLK